jgi:hypothetical protein
VGERCCAEPFQDWISVWLSLKSDHNGYSDFACLHRLYCWKGNVIRKYDSCASMPFIVENRLLKRHQTATLSAISQRNIITWTLIVLEIGLRLSKFTQSSTRNCYSNSEQVGQCSCSDVTTLLHLPLRRRNICYKTCYWREGNRLSK